MDEPDPLTAPSVTPSWRQEPRSLSDEDRARRLRRRAWRLLAVLAVVVGALLGLISSFRWRPYPAFLPIVVNGNRDAAGSAMAFVGADLRALTRRGLFARTIGMPGPLGPDETVARRLERLGDVSSFESLVIYLDAPARARSNEEVEVLGTQAGGDEPDRCVGCDLQLVNDRTKFPTAPKDLIIVARENNVLHFLMFDANGKDVVNTDETRLPERARQIDDLRKELVPLWPPHQLVESEKSRLSTAVKSIVGHTRWISLRDILAQVADCPARNRLVLLDLMRPMADPIGRILADDVAARIEPAVASAARAGRELLVLSACGPGQRSWASEELGRSVFSLAVEEGLLGWADTEGGDGDGRVTVRELARYVTRRTNAWTWHNRGARQTPVLLEHGGSGNFAADFVLARRNRIEMTARQAAVEPEARTYPDWLKAAWARRDGLVAEGTDRLAPRSLRRLSAALLAAERDWRAGVDPGQIQPRLETDSTEPLRQFAAAKAAPRLPVYSLALEEIEGRAPTPAVLAAGEMLVKRMRPAVGLKPEEAAAAQAKLLADFQAATQDMPDLDVARAVFAAAADTTVPGPQAIIFLDGLLRARQPAPGWVEIVALRRLADRAELIALGKLAAEAWKPASVRKLLSVIRQGEQAHARAGSPGWVEPWLSAAAQARHLGEVAFDAVGFVPSDQADGHLDRATVLYSAVLATQDRYQSAVRLRDAALAMLPGFLPYLDHAPELLADWSEAARAAEALDAALAVTPPEIEPATRPDVAGPMPGLEVLRAASDGLDRLTASLESPLSRLRAPFRTEAIAGLLARAKEATADAPAWRAIAARLETPTSSAEQRAALWTAGHELGRRMAGKTRVEVPSPSRPDEAAMEDPSVAVRRDLARRAAEALALLRLAGLGAKKAEEYGTEIRPFTEASDRAGRSLPSQAKTDWPELGSKLHGAWAELIDSTNPRDLAARCRLVRVLPGAIGATAIDLGLDDPVAEIRKRKNEALQTWLADWFRYVGTDRDLDFFLVAAQEYRRGLGNASRRPTVGITARVQPIALGESEGPGPQAQTLDLAIELEAGTVKPAGIAGGVASKTVPRISVRVIQPVRDWLDVGLDRSQIADIPGQARISSEPGSGRFVIDPGESGRAIPLRLRLKARDRVGAARRTPEPEDPPPAGILVEAEVQGRVFSRPVPVVVLSAADAFRIILGNEFQDQAGARQVMLLRPLAGRQPVPLSVRNPTATAREVTVELRLGTSPSDPVVMSPRLTVGTNATQPVAFAGPTARGTATDAGAPASPAAGSARGPGPSPADAAIPSDPKTVVPLAELQGPLRLRVLDARRPEVVLGERIVAVEVARPADYVRVQEASLAPSRPVADEPNRLSVSLRSLLPPSDPATTIEMVLRPERIPGLVGVE